MFWAEICILLRVAVLGGIALFDQGAFADIFTVTTNYPVGSGPDAVCLAGLRGKVHGDKLYRDLVVANYNDSTVNVRLCLDNGNFGQNMQSYSVGTNPVAVHFGDFNNDGWDDLVTANFGTNTVSVLMNLGVGANFQTADFNVGRTNCPNPGPRDVVVADINRDGRLDLLVANYYENTVSVLTNNGHGSFGGLVNYDIGDGIGPVSIRVADMNRDGLLDVITANTNGSITILPGLTLTQITNVIPPGQTNSFTFTNMSTIQVSTVALGQTNDTVYVTNSDGTLTVTVVTNVISPAQTSYTFGPAQTVWLFDPDVDLDANPQPVCLTVGYLSTNLAPVVTDGGDGEVVSNAVEALVVANQNSNTVSVLYGAITNGQWFPQSQMNYDVGPQPKGLLLRDVNHDGVADISVVSSNCVQVLLGANDGSFSSQATNYFGSNLVAISGSNFNGDNATDLAVVDSTNNVVYILLNSEPLTYNVQQNINENTPTPITLIGSILSSNSLQFVVITNFNGGSWNAMSTTNLVYTPQGDGTWSVTTTSLVYNPPTNYIGTDNFTYLLATVDSNSVSTAASGTINIPATILKQPGSLTNLQGQVATFNVTVPGSGVTYQWYSIINASTNPIVGATNTSYANNQVDLGDIGNYFVVVAKNGSSVTSSYAWLKVNRDTNAPVVTIVSPKTKFETNAATILITGTATDNARLSQVWVGVNNAFTTSANVTNSKAGAATWGAMVTLSPGTNLVTAKAVDFATNSSAIKTNTYFLQVPSVFTVITNTSGTGTVSIKPVELVTTNHYIGRTYLFTATPDMNSLLSNIVNVATSGTTVYPNSAPPTKGMKNMAVQAEASNTVTINFVTNRFIGATGNYNGLFTNSVVAKQSAGFITVTPTKTLTYSGKLYSDGDPFKTLSGTFDMTGASTVTVTRTNVGKPPLIVNLRLGFDGTLIGTVISADWTANIDADQVVFSATTPTTNYNGKYTLLIPGGFDSATNGPTGDGYATLTVAPVGTVTAAGFLADNQAFAPLAAPVSGSGRWPVYAPLYVTNGVGHNGMVLGWVQFTSNAPTAIFNGDLHWIKTAGTNGFYNGGFTNEVTAIGSVYTAPATGQRGIFIANGLAILTGGNLPLPTTNNITITNPNTISVSNTNSGGQSNSMKLTFAASSGVVSGAFKNPANSIATTQIKSTYLQNQNYIGGFFLGTNQAGSFLLQTNNN